MMENLSALSRDDRDRAMPRSEYAYRALREAIHSGHLKPGQRIREIEVAELLGISRTPTREAIKKLEAEGILTSSQSRGFVVTQLEYTQILELYSMREVLEGTAARFAAQHASAMEIRAMRDLLERQASQGENDLALAQINRHLHGTIYDASRNRYLLSSLHALTDALALLEGTTFSVPGRPGTSLAEHHAIVEAIAQRNPDEAEQAARRHICEGGRLRVQMITEARHSLDKVGS